MKKIIFILIGFIVVVLLIVGFIKKQSNITSSPKQSVVTEIAQIGSLPQKNIFGALVKNSEEAIISAQLGGSVQKIYVQEGNEVKKGQILAIISAPEISAQYAQADKGVQIVQEQEKRARRNWDDYKPEEREQFKLQTEQYRAVRAESSAMLAKLKIVAPFDGIISKKYVTEGETIMPGSQIMYVVGNTNHKEILIDVPNFVGDMINVGDSVDVFDNEKKIEAKIIAISPVSDAISRKTMIRISFEKDVSFGLGTFVNVAIFDNKSVNGIKILKESIVNQYDDLFVFVVKNQKTEMKNVDIIAESDGFVVVSGIDEGDEIVVSGAHNLQDGEEVLILEK